MNTQSSYNDTIAAPATAPGRGGIGIIRASGPNVTTLANAVLGTLPQPRHALYTPFYDAKKRPIDEGIALYFNAPRSFTGEDMLELHGHGGPVVMDLLLQRLLALGARMANPGEFSERAYLNNKLDLAQAEAIADLIDATSIQAAQGAMRSLQGEFSKQIQLLVEQITQLRIYIEAAIDFPEEEIDFLADTSITTRLNTLISQVKKVLSETKQGRLLRDGMTLVITGSPNAGKSSLLNCLSGHDAAIVTDIPGTTRDLLREHVQIDGLPLHIIDTAGLRESPDQIEREGIKRAQAAMHEADGILLVIDHTDSPHSQHNAFAIPEPIQPYLNTQNIIVVLNKIDLTDAMPSIEQHNGLTVIKLSAKTGNGVTLLREHLKTLMGYHANTETVFTARQRHLHAIDNTLDHLLQGQEQLINFHAGDLLAEELRLAQQALSSITGSFTADDLLGEIFSSFCIGK